MSQLGIPHVWNTLSRLGLPNLWNSLPTGFSLFLVHFVFENKVKLCKLLVISIILYGCGTWTLPLADSEKRVQATCLRKLLYLSSLEQKAHERVWNKISVLGFCRQRKDRMGRDKEWMCLSTPGLLALASSRKDRKRISAESSLRPPLPPLPRPNRSRAELI